jgi:hypothetical protein
MGQPAIVGPAGAEPPVLEVPLDELALPPAAPVDDDDDELEEVEAWEVEVAPPVPVLVAWLEPHAASARDTSATDDDVRACAMMETRRAPPPACCQAREREAVDARGTRLARGRAKRVRGSGHQ